MTEADRLIALLELTPHPEGGHYRETFRDVASSDGRSLSTAVYFLLKGEPSRVHRIDAAEIWHWYRGAPLELVVENRDGTRNVTVLGNDIAQGERPQAVVPPGCWQRARSLGPYTLVGCTVAPGFEFTTFELASDARK